METPLYAGGARTGRSRITEPVRENLVAPELTRDDVVLVLEYGPPAARTVVNDRWHRRMHRRMNWSQAPVAERDARDPAQLP